LLRRLFAQSFFANRKLLLQNRPLPLLVIEAEFLHRGSFSGRLIRCHHASETFEFLRRATLAARASWVVSQASHILAAPNTASNLGQPIALFRYSGLAAQQDEPIRVLSARGAESGLRDYYARTLALTIW
jgi:hypothetical protein